MDVRIGLAETPQVIEVEMADNTDREGLKKKVDEVLNSGESVLWLEDRKGKEFAIAASRIAFVEVSSVDQEHRIGFGA